jgi:ABC-type polysaccharide/polyol phosphate transport system ATPase subunit
MPIIELDSVTKRFRVKRGGRVFLGRGGLADLVRGKAREQFTALENISFNVEAGESLGIIGANGSGKSTLLKIIGGVTAPTEGNVHVRGRVASLLELGAGFHPMLTGRENVYLNAGILGMRHRQVDAVFDQIVEFSGIGKFIDFPVDTYSSGMYVRIGFAVAAFTNPDVFLIDEVLSVGDESFQRRCRRRIGELMDQGKTIVFVSHDLGIVNTLCERVVLLSQGKMILRDSTSKAISFYLRQMGAEATLHTMSAGDLEAIKCEGRISLFYDQEEVTPASGLQFQVFHLGHWHNASDADWEITNRSETGCTARGHMAKLNATFVWNLSIEDGEFVWRMTIDCERPMDSATLEANFFYPTTYTQWTYDDANGRFQELRPEDTNWLAATSPELLCESAAVLPEADSKAPAVVMSFDTSRAHIRGSWLNTDYMTGCRVLRVEEHAKFAPGEHELFTVRIRPGADRAALESRLGAKSQRQTLVSGDLTCRFDRGRIRLSYKGTQVTSVVHVYASMFIRNLWHDSMNLRWDSFERTEDLLRFEGASRRAPLRMIWELQPDDDGLALTIRLVVEETIDIQEYHTSVGLKEAYNEWKTPHESGAFPAFTTDMNDWEHLNDDYTEGSYAEAASDQLPTVRIEVEEGIATPRMTALNTSHRERGRVLQALFAPDHGAFHLDPGEYVYFRGRVVVRFEKNDEPE